MPEAICICGAYPDTGECDRKCAGALAQKAECERHGHVTFESMSVVPDHQPSAFGFCFRCGWKSPERLAYEKLVT